MKRSYLTRDRVVAAIAAAVLAAVAGCDAGDDSTDPEPTLPAGYQQPPEDTCDRAQFDQLRQRWDLTALPGHEPATDYQTERVWWYVRCGFAGQATGGRFETELGKFSATGAATLYVYHDTAEAVEKYDQDLAGYIERPEDGVPAEVTGWWDTGASVLIAEKLDPEDTTLDDFEVTSLDHRLLVRHENLVALVYLDARSPTEDTDAAGALLEEIAAALLDETVAPLPRTG